MRRIAPQVFVILLVVSSACCTPPKPLQNTPETTTYICQWTNIEVSQGVAVVTEGNPKGKSVKELADKGVAFRVKQERTMDCQALKPPKELRKVLPPNVINTPVPPPKKGKPAHQYINNTEEI